MDNQKAMFDVERHDIVQIVPEHDWGGSLVIVTEVRTWGIQGFVQIPQGGQAHIRLSFADFEKVGRAAFALQE